MLPIGLVCFITILSNQLTPIQAQTANITTLKYVHALWRHGDRTPQVDTFPSDTGNQAYTWPEGIGELTMLGVRQQYELGKYLRNRYDGFLQRNYNASQIYVRSTNFNRAIASADSNMAGLFEPEGDQIWNTNLRWRPVPVQNMPKENDPMLWTNRPCPTADKLFLDYTTNSPDLRQLAQQYSRLLNFLEVKTGINRPIQLYKDVYNTYDNLLCELVHNETHKWPSWMNMTIYEELTALNDITVQKTFPTPELRRLRGGLLLGDMLSRMQNQTSANADKQQKFYAYSAHDSTITAFLNNLGAPQPHAPPYAALVLVELHQRNNDYFVEISYRNDTTRDPYVIEVENCPRPCSLKQFASSSQPRIPKDWYKECGIDKCPNNQQASAGSSFIDTLNSILRNIFNPSASNSPSTSRSI